MKAIIKLGVFGMELLIILYKNNDKLYNKLFIDEIMIQ